MPRPRLRNYPWSLQGDALSTGGILVANHASLNPTATVALEIWVKPTQGVSTILFDNSEAGTTLSYFLSCDGNGLVSWFSTIGGLAKNFSGSSALCKMNEWNLVSAWYNGTDVNIAVNRTLAGTLAATGSLGVNTGQLRIARYFTGSVAPLRGNVTRPRIYNRVYTLQDHRDRYDLDKDDATMRSGLVLEYTLTEGQGTSVTDGSGNGNTGTVGAGFTWAFDAPFKRRVPQSAAPTWFTGLVAWYGADVGITKDGSDKVSQWNDQSGNGYHLTQGTGSLQPVWQASSINSLPAVRLTTVGDEKMTATTNYPGGFRGITLYTVIKANAAPTAAFTGIVGIGTGAAGGQTQSLGVDNTGKLWGGGAGLGSPLASAVVSGTSYLFGKSNNGRGDRLWLNGFWTDVTTPQTSAYNVSPATSLVLAEYTGAGVPSNMDVAELVFFNRELTDDEMSSMNNYFATKYGFTTYIRTAVSGRIAQSGEIAVA